MCRTTSNQLQKIEILFNRALVSDKIFLYIICFFDVETILEEQVYLNLGPA